MRSLIGRRAGAAAGGGRDPAPSRLAYRLHRLWLTPGFRLLLRVGLPLVLAFGAGFHFLGTPENRGVVMARLAEAAESVKTRPEFMVKLVAIEGASPPVARLIRETFPVAVPVSSFDLDLELLQAEISELDVVEQAEVRVRPGGVLEIAVVERVPAVIWRTPQGLALLDRRGNHIAYVPARASRPDLPLLAGPGAEDAVPEALALIRAAGPLGARLRGLVRVGQRRWDMELTGGRSIALPERDPVAALAQVIALDQAEDLLARAITRVDMRNPARPTLRLAPQATEEMRRIKAIELGVEAR